MDFFKLLIGLMFYFFFVNSMGKNRESVMVMKIILKFCFEFINFIIVLFVIFKNVLCIKIIIFFYNDVGMV